MLRLRSTLIVILATGLHQ